MSKHICGKCKVQFEDETSYLDHVCTKTSFKPTQAEHLGPEFAEVQKAALKRGEERK